MCRWFAYISPSEPCLLADMLIEPPHGITKQVSSHYLPYLTHHQYVDNMVNDVIQSDPSAGPKPGKQLAPSTATDDNEKMSRDVRLRNLMLNADGAGVAFYTTSKCHYNRPSIQPPILHPAVYKSTQILLHDLNFLSLAENVETTCLLTHVRADVGGAPVSTLNCHPYIFGRWSIMHNGEIGGFGAVKRQLLDSLSPDAYAGVYGGTDSEAMAALIVDALTEGAGQESWHAPRLLKAVLDAVQKAFAVIHAAQKQAGVKELNSLNVCVTDGTMLVATRWRNSEDSQPPSLYWSDKAGKMLNQKFAGHPDPKVHEELKHKKTDVTNREHGRHVIVASEPTTFVEEDWKLIPRNTALLVDENGNVDNTKLGPY